jgi:hypothetical protein
MSESGLDLQTLLFEEQRQRVSLESKLKALESRAEALQSDNQSLQLALLDKDPGTDDQ